MRKTAKLFRTKKSRTTTRKSRSREIRRNPRASGPKKNKTDEPPVKSLKATTTRKSLKVKAKNAPAGVQKHGKEWENAIITVVVSSSDLEEAMTQSHTATHDVPKHLNKKNPGTHLSIKATGSSRVDFGDAKRTIQNLSKPDSPLEAIVVRYKQSGTTKIPTSVLRINLTEAKDVLLGNDPDGNISSRIEQLDRMVKDGDDSYKKTAKDLQKYMKDNGASLVLAPKIGNKDKKRSGRLQISLSNVEHLIKDYPQFVTIEKDCQVYGEDCLLPLESGRRVLSKKTKPTSAAFAENLSAVVEEDEEDEDAEYLAEEAHKKMLNTLPEVQMVSMMKKDSKEDDL